MTKLKPGSFVIFAGSPTMDNAKTNDGGPPRNSDLNHDLGVISSQGGSFGSTLMDDPLLDGCEVTK